VIILVILLLRVLVAPLNLLVSLWLSARRPARA
jgi:hypothetical protein